MCAFGPFDAANKLFVGTVDPGDGTDAGNPTARNTKKEKKVVIIIIINPLTRGEGEKEEVW